MSIFKQASVNKQNVLIFFILLCIDTISVDLKINKMVHKENWRKCKIRREMILFRKSWACQWNRDNKLCNWLSSSHIRNYNMHTVCENHFALRFWIYEDPWLIMRQQREQNHRAAGKVKQEDASKVELQKRGGNESEVKGSCMIKSRVHLNAWFRFCHGNYYLLVCWLFPLV